MITGGFRMYSKLKESLAKELQNIKEAGLSKDERIIVAPKGLHTTYRMATRS